MSGGPRLGQGLINKYNKNVNKNYLFTNAVLYCHLVNRENFGRFLDASRALCIFFISVCNWLTEECINIYILYPYINIL